MSSTPAHAKAADVTRVLTDIVRRVSCEEAIKILYIVIAAALQLLFSMIPSGSSKSGEFVDGPTAVSASAGDGSVQASAHDGGEKRLYTDD